MFIWGKLQFLVELLIYQVILRTCLLKAGVELLLSNINESRQQRQTYKNMLLVLI